MNYWLTKTGLVETKATSTDTFWKLYPKVPGVPRNRMTQGDIDAFERIAHSKVVLFKHPGLTVEYAEHLCRIGDERYGGIMPFSLYLRADARRNADMERASLVTKIVYDREFLIESFSFDYAYMNIMLRKKIIDDLLPTL